MASKLLYISVADALLKRIISGEWAVGQTLPSESVLMTAYECGRATIRTAMESLAQRGYVAKYQGIGTIVTAPPAMYDNNKPISFTEEMTQLRKMHHTKTLKFEVIKDSDIAEELNLSKTEDIIYLKRLRFVENNAALLETTYLPEKYFPLLTEKDIETMGLYHALTEKYKIFRMTINDKYSVALLDRDSALLLKMNEGEPVIKITRHSVNDNRVIEYTEAVSNSEHYPLTFNIVRG